MDESKRRQDEAKSRFPAGMTERNAKADRRWLFTDSRGRGTSRLVLILLPEPGGKPKHQLDTLDLVQPISERRIDFTLFGCKDSSGAHRAEAAAGECAVAAHSAVPRSAAALPELSLRIIEFTREHGRVTISDIVRLTGTSRNTLKQHFRQLVAQRHLVLHGNGRGAWYALS